MPTAKLSSNTLYAMKSEEGNDSLDTFIRQATGKEPFFSFSRAGDNPVQWIQMLHNLEQQDHHGWPLLSPIKVQMQKCAKCSQEFCSTINYRRHMRVHRRKVNFDQNSMKNRDLLGNFWDKLSLDELEEVVSFNDVKLEEAFGLSIINSLTSFIRKPGFYCLPQAYVKAGSALLDIIQVIASNFPISSQELFNILDDASERTFLCAGTAESVQKYVFDGGAEKIGLEMKNLIACTCFLFEQKLVKAWLADMEAEALRCQELLVEEEEAAQKRQSQLMEKRRSKKLKQREQKTKGHKSITDITAHIMDDVPSESSSSSISHTPVAEQDHVEPIQFSHVEDADIEAQPGFCIRNSDSNMYQDVERRALKRNGHRYLPIARWKVQTSHRDEESNQGAMIKLSARRNLNGNKVWTPKPKLENYDERLCSGGKIETLNQPDENEKYELLIGSISVPLRRKNVEEKPLKPDTCQNGVNQSTSKLWSPVSRHGSGISTPVQSEPEETQGFQFNSKVAKAFLSQRWKEAISADHVQLVLYPESEIQNDEQETLANVKKHNILGNEDNRVINGNGRTKTKSEKGVKLKYIPKQKLIG